jgi:hypothetical protein
MAATMAALHERVLPSVPMMDRVGKAAVTARTTPGGTRASAPPTQANGLLGLQRAIGNRAVGLLLGTKLRVDRKQYTEGSKQAPFAPTPKAKSQARFVVDKGLNNQAIAAGTTIGKYTFTAVAGASAGTLGYEKFKGKTYCGGRTFANADGQLPGATTYTEWDVAEYAAGARGVERVVVGANAKAYYTNNHYADFVEIRT